MNRNDALKIFVVLTFTTMVVVNALANILPINGTNTGEVSNSFPNLFAPAAVTFSIWGVIYLLLAAYSFYQLGIFQKDRGKSKSELFKKINVYFSITSIANVAWIFAWHYRFIGISLLLMSVILFNLILITDLLNKQRLSLKESVFIRLPFSVYFGWITVATIANITTYLVSINWTGLGLSNQLWMLVILLIGTAIGNVRTIKDRNAAYGGVLIWAFLGILIKHTAIDGFNFKYPMVIAVTIACLLTFVATTAFVIFKKKSPLPR